MNGQFRKEEHQAWEILKKYDQSYLKYRIQDKPDLISQDNKNGVEITIACYENQCHMAHIIHDLTLCESEKQRKRKQKNADQKLTEFNFKPIPPEKLPLPPYSGYSSDSPNARESRRLLMSSVIDKIFKLHDYKYLDSCELFIFDQTDTLSELNFERQIKWISQRYCCLITKSRCSQFYQRIYVFNERYSKLGIISMENECSFEKINGIVQN